MSGPRYVFVLGYGVTIGNPDDPWGITLYQRRVVENRDHADELCEQAKREGHVEADVYMLIPPDTFPNGGRD